MPKQEHKTINGFKHILYPAVKTTSEQALSASTNFFEFMNQRRSVRTFSDQPVDKKIIETIIKTAGTAPSGAHKQPWTFCAIADQKIKKEIRIAAELEEKRSYESRMSESWLKDLAPLGTDMHKPFLEIAPWLIVVFKRAYELDEDKTALNNYYVNESVGIACGMLISAIHQAGLVTLTHTPSPMKFLHDILGRPENERPFLLLPVGYPQDPSYVPELQRKSIDEIAVFYE